MDVSGDNGTSACHLLAYVFGSDMTLDTQCLAVHVFTNGHILHLGSDDTCLSTRHLGDALPLLSTVGNPLLAHGGQSLLQVNRIVGVGIRTAGIVDIHWFVLLYVGFAVGILRHRWCQVHLGHTHLYIRINRSLHICFLTLCVSFVIIDHTLQFFNS